MVVIDREYKYTYVNFAAPGLRIEDMIGKATPFDFVAPSDHAAMLSLGYSVKVACRGDEALAQLESGLEFDLLLTDVVLPGLDGGELHRQALARRPGLKVVFMSGYTHNLIEKKGILTRDAHFLQKPFSLDDLAAKLRVALDAPAPIDRSGPTLAPSKG